VSPNHKPSQRGVRASLTAKLNGLDPEAYLADVIGRIGDHPAKRISQLLPWKWRDDQQRQAA
jgi:hypothetical protein